MFSQHHKESAFSKQYIKLNLNFCFETDIHDHGYILSTRIYRSSMFLLYVPLLQEIV